MQTTHQKRLIKELRRAVPILARAMEDHTPVVIFKSKDTIHYGAAIGLSGYSYSKNLAAALRRAVVEVERHAKKEALKKG